MSRVLSTLLALLLLIAGAVPVAAADEKAPAPDTDVVPTVSSAGEVVPGEVVVKFYDPDAAPRVAQARGLPVVAALGAPARGMPSVLSTAGRPVDQVLGELRADPNVEYAEPNYIVRRQSAGREPGKRWRSGPTRRKYRAPIRSHPTMKEG